MDKVEICIFYGPNFEFKKMIADYKYYLDISTILSVSSLSIFNERLKGDSDDKKLSIKYSIDNPNLQAIIVHSSDYALLSDAGEKGLAEYIKNTLDASKEYSDIKNIFLQNPTKNIVNLIERVFSDEKNYKIKKIYYEHKDIEKTHIKDFYEKFSLNIIGQELVKNELLKSLYYMKSKNNKKPIVLMFYGASGVGKTETAKFLSSLFGGKILRIQMSMFQNYASKDYLFGTSHNANSFSKDLLERETNIILLDEFDKVSHDIISAFYQMFDEGIYEDRNYTVNLNNSIIICTSNFYSKKEIKETLGDPMFYRFNKLIYFQNLSKEDIFNVCMKIYADIKNNLKEEYISIIESYDDIFSEVFIEIAKKRDMKMSSYYNFRNLKNIISNLVEEILINKFIEDNY